MHHDLRAVATGLVFRLVLTATFLFTGVAGSPRLAAQSTAERVALDSILLRIVDSPLGTAPEPARCAGHPRPLTRLCEGLELTRKENVGLVLSEVRRLEFFVRGPERRTTSTLQQGILKFNQVIFERPKWAPGYFALAQVLLDFHRRPDSALRLLTTARNLPGMAPGLIDLTIARLRLEFGERVLGWQAFQRAAADTNSITHQFIARTLVRFTPPTVAEEFLRIPAAERADWLRSTPGVAATILDGLGFRPPFRLRTRSYGLERDGGRVVVSFSLGSLELLGEELPNGRTHFPVRTRLIATRVDDGTEFVVDTVRHFTTTFPPPRGSYGPRWCGANGVLITPETPCVVDALNRFVFVTPTLQPADPWLQATTELPLPPGRYFLALTLSQEDGKRGVTTMLPPVVIPPADRTSLTMSDLVLGWEGHGVPWRSPARTVPLNPYSEWSPDAVMTLYTQLSGLKADADYQVQLDVVSLDPKRGGESSGRRTLSFTEHAASDRVEWYREMSVKGLLPGPYRVTVSVTQAEMTLRRSEEIVVVE